MILQCCSTAEQHRLSRRVAAAFCRTRCAACLSSPAQGSGFQPCLLPSPFPALSSNDLVDVLTLWCERLAHHSPARRSAASGLTRPALKPCQPHTVKVTPLHILPAPGCRAYKLGRSRWSYHQIELKIAEQAGSRRGVVPPAAPGADPHRDPAGAAQAGRRIPRGRRRRPPSRGAATTNRGGGAFRRRSTRGAARRGYWPVLPLVR